jgi:hypothetical protein
MIGGGLFFVFVNWAAVRSPGERAPSSDRRLAAPFASGDPAPVRPPGPPGPRSSASGTAISTMIAAVVANAVRRFRAVAAPSGSSAAGITSSCVILPLTQRVRVFGKPVNLPLDSSN